MSKYQIVIDKLDYLYNEIGVIDEGDLKPDIIEALNLIFSIKAMGFREVTFLIAITKLIYPNFKATENLYEFNPRPFYEQGMKWFFEKHSIPHGQSGPLNIAKGTEKINLQWANGRRPQEAGVAVVKIASYIDGILNQDDSIKISKILMQRFFALAEEVASLSIEHTPLSNPDELSNILNTLIRNAVDGGNTPQRVVGYIIEQSFNSGNLQVTGHEDSASTTNTTSKKPGDVQITDLISGDLICIYEITVKKFDEQRLQESFMSIVSFLQDNEESNISEVTVICREEDAPVDIRVNHCSNIQYNGLRYNFVDIYRWIEFKMYDLPTTSRLELFSKLDAYISDFNTSVKVKEEWNRILSNS